MSETFQNLTPVDEKLFFRKNDRNDLRLGEIVPNTKYEDAEIVILGCPQDEGVKRNNGRIGAALDAPNHAATYAQRIETKVIICRAAPCLQPFHPSIPTTATDAQ